MRMQIIALLILSCFYAVGAAHAQGVTLSVEKAKLEEVFDKISQQTGYHFNYRINHVDKYSVTFSVKNSNIRETLAACLARLPLIYQITDKIIVIQPKLAEQDSTDQKRSQLQAEVSGRVISIFGSPLASATVMIKKTGRGTVTDANGRFRLKEIIKGDVIVVSYTGYEKSEVIYDKDELIIAMKPAVTGLEQVVVQGYGKTTYRQNTGNIITVTAEEIARQPVSNPLQALQGKVSGLVATMTGGYASSPIKVEIRGRNTVSPTATTEPLYIIDGVPLSVLDINGNGTYATGSPGFVQSKIGPVAANGQSPFFSINPSDIETITVLKDADATAIYGSRGANGVIIITTKKGTAGNTNLDIRVYQGVSEAIGKWEMLNTQQYLSIRREAFLNDNLQMNESNAYDLLVWDTTRYTDWQKYMWGGSGKVTNAQLGLSGGEGRTTFRIGLGYRNENSITSFTGSDQKVNASINLGHKDKSQKFSANFSSIYAYTESDLIDMNGQVTIAPNAPPIFNEHGNLNYSGWDPVTYQFSFGNLLSPYTSKTTFHNSRLQLDYNVGHGINFSSSIGYSTMNNAQHTTNPIASKDPNDNPTGTAVFGSNKSTSLIIEPQLNYDLVLGKGKLSTMIGATYNRIFQETSIITGEGYTNDNLLGSISNAPVSRSNDNAGEYKYAAIFGRLNYNILDRYILNISMRRDGSSRFGPGKQFGNFGAVGTTWIITDEPWMKINPSIISFGKIRASYGIVGSDKIGDYEYLTRWSGSNLVPYQGAVSLIPTQHANTEYHWQTDRKLEGALSIHFLNDKIKLEAAWYRNICDNQLVPMPLPLITGFPNVTANFPAKVENKGWEFLLSANMIEKKDISWSLNFNFSANKNTVVAFPDLDKSPYANQIVVGRPLTMRRALRFLGVDPQTGYYSFEDKNKDGEIDSRPSTSEDYYFYDMNPKFFGGLGSDFRFRKWELNLMFYYKKQLGTNALTSSGWLGQPGLNLPVEVLNHWKKPGDIAQFAKSTNISHESFGFYGQSDALISDASFIRLQNISLTYTFDQQWLKRIGSEKMSIYLSAQNLFVITDYKGVDPEVQNFGRMPIPRIVTAGLQLNF